MRQLLVKFFVLDYFFKVFGIRFIIPRTSTIIYPIFLISGVIICFFTPSWPIPNIGLWVMYLINTIVLFFGFIYFRFKPAKWNELDNFQKFQYGTITRLKGQEYVEWVKLFHKVRNEFFS